MSSNRQTLEDMFRRNEIDLCRGSIFGTQPRALLPEFNFEKVEGMMLGLAIGDALGITTESWLPHRRRESHGIIRDYIPNRYAKVPIGYPSDDSQMAFWTLDQMLEDGGLVPEHIADCFCQHHIYGIGSAVREFIANRKKGLPWHKCGSKSAGNGALMRIAPVLIPHLKHPTADLWVDAALAAMITHNDAASTAACVALVNLLWQVLAMDTVPEPQWWLKTYVQVAKELEGDTKYRPRSDAIPEYEGPIWRFVEKRVSDAYQNGMTTLDACNQWYSGAYLLETVPSVIYILMKHGNDLEEAIVRAVNDTKDNDTVAAIVGAAVGALHGKRAIPERWIRNLSGRTTDCDDGKVFELLAAARSRWGSVSLAATCEIDRRTP